MRKRNSNHKCFSRSLFQVEDVTAHYEWDDIRNVISNGSKIAIKDCFPSD